MKYQWNGKGFKATCLHCGKDYSEHEERTLNCPNEIKVKEN